MAQDGTQNQDDRPIWGGRAIAAAAGLPDRAAAYHMIKAGLLPARKVGHRYVSSAGLLKQALTGGDRRSDIPNVLSGAIK